MTRSFGASAAAIECRAEHALPAAWAKPSLPARSLPLLAALLLAVLVCCQQALAQPAGADDPPPRDHLLAPVPRPTGNERAGTIHAKVFCNGIGSLCTDPLSPDSVLFYRRVRRFWSPPGNTTITTAIWFGADARAVTADGAESDAILMALQLDHFGGLLKPLRAIVPDRPRFSKEVVADLQRAIESGQPYDMFPLAQYEQWKDVLLRVKIQPMADGDIGRGGPRQPRQGGPAK
jgi:hypothetical protein